MADTIKPGSTVEVKVVKAPRSKGARYTLGRLFLRDPAVRKSRTPGPKPLRRTPRGGRLWRARPRGSDVQVPAVGDVCTVRASVDTIRDLSSVANLVDITPK